MENNENDIPKSIEYLRIDNEAKSIVKAWADKDKKELYLESKDTSHIEEIINLLKATYGDTEVQTKAIEVSIYNLEIKHISIPRIMIYLHSKLSIPTEINVHVDRNTLDLEIIGNINPKLKRLFKRYNVHNKGNHYYVGSDGFDEILSYLKRVNESIKIKIKEK